MATSNAAAVSRIAQLHAKRRKLAKAIATLDAQVDRLGDTGIGPYLKDAATRLKAGKRRTEDLIAERDLPGLLVADPSLWDRLGWRVPEPWQSHAGRVTPGLRIAVLRAWALSEHHNREQ